MLVLVVRTLAVLCCVTALLTGCEKQSQTYSTSTTLYAAPTLGVVTDAHLRVVTIDAGGAAAHTALQRDDIITHWKNLAVTVRSLREQIATTNPTETIEMTVERGGVPMFIPVQLRSSNQANTGSNIPSTPTPVPADLYSF